MKRDRNIIAIFVILFSFFLVNNLVDAKISISDDISYVLGEKIKGNIYLELDDNDFVPMDSELVVSLAGQEKKLRLFEVLEIDSAEGNFYVENFNISGSGQGYEKPKDKIIYPEVYFKLLLKEGAEIPSKESVSPEIGEACTPSISCGEWGDCINSYQTRLCISMNKECIESNINEERECFIEEEIEETVEEEIVDVEEVVEGEEIEEVEGEVVEGEVEEIETEEVEEEITEDPIKDPIPEELLDITFDLEENSLNSADKLIVWISLQSFGKNYIPARLVYIIEDVNKIEIYREFEEIRIYSEVSIIKKFEGLSLDSGDYTLIFHVEYSGIVEEFRSKFTIKTGVFNLIGSWVKELFGLNYVPFLEVTGKVVDDLSTNGPVSSTETEIEGIVSKDTPFTYNLGKRNSIEIIDGSIRTDSINLSDNDINLDIEGREIIITTQYFEEKDLEDEYFLKIPLEKFDIIAKTGTLGVKLIYQDISLIELSKDIKGEEVSEVIDDSLEPETNESLDEIKVVNETSDVTLEEGVEDVVSVNVIQYKAVLNRPVKWISEIDGENIGDIKIPIEANDIRVGTEDDVQKFLDEILEYEDLVEGIDRKDILDESLTGIVDEDIWNDKNIAEKITYSISNLPSRVGLTNGVASGGEVEEHISIVDNDKIIEVDKIVDTTVSKKVLIEYYTDAPLSKEIIISNFKKKIIISGPDIHYDNILAYTELSKESESSKIRLYHLISGGREEVEIVKYDLNENGLIDYIEWVVPSLSSQTYELEIEITKAEHLDSNRNLISDIYEEVKSLDGVWSEVIPSQDFVRVTFEQNLTSSNDITIYARKISGKPSIEVYEIGGTDVIAEFSSLVDNEYNKVLLNNLVGIQDTFDLKIIGGGIEFDHIIDPATENLFDDCLNLDKWNNPSGGWVIAQGKCRNANTKGSIESLILLNSIDLTGVDWAEFSFDMDNAGLESGDYLRVYVNSSIESWQLLLDTNSNAAEFHSFNIANSITMTTGVHVRFETLSNANNDKISIDNINITSFVSDIPVLDMTIVFPENKTYGSIAIPLNFNVTLNANGSVHYSLDGGVTNISMTGDEGNAFGTVFNAINTSISDGFYTFQAYGNDTSGSNNYFESVSFSIDATAPSVSFVPPTSNGSQSNNNIYVNFSTISSRNHYSFVNFDNDLLLWLRMDEVSGNTVIDLSGESNNGVIVGDAHQIQDGRFGAAFDFDGIPDGDSTDAINLSGFQTKYPGVFNESFTAVAWIKANKVAKMAPFGTKGITNWPGWHFRTGGTNRVKFGVNTGYDDVSGTSASVETTDPIIANTWIHMVGIYDQTVPSISLYLNGILIGTRTANVSSTGYANDQWLAVASQEDPTKVWDGQIDEVMIFKRALTSSEVGSLYDATATQYEHNFTGLGNNGSYTFTGYAVDVLGNKNEIERTVTISEGGGGPVDPTLSFVLTPSNSEDYLIVTTATGGSCPSELTCNLYRDGVAVTNGETVTLSAGTYNYDYNTTGNVNYTNGSVGDILTVNQISPVGSLTNSTLWTVNYGTLITVGLVESNTGDSDLTYIIYRDGISVGTGESIILSAGTYNYVLNTSGGTNYSANSAMDFETLVVSPIASSTSLSFDVSSPQDFGVAITPSCSVVSGDGSAVLTMDGSVISSGVAITPGAGALTFNCSLGVSQNYTSSENVSVYTVSPISSIVNLTLNSSSSDITIFAGDSINLGCSVVTGDSLATVELYREGLLIDSGVSSVINLTTFNIVQVENITCSYVDSGNYTTSFETFFVNVTPVPDTTPPFFTTIPLDANINYGEILSVDFDATDNVLFDSFLINWSDTFSINSAGLLVNVSPLSGGSYSINVSINDSSGNVNWTIYSVVVNPISPGLSFALTPSNSEDYLVTVTATGSGCPSQLSCDLYRDGSIVTNGESVTLSAGSYNYDYNTTGNVNYTSGSAVDTLTVNSVSPVGSLTNSTSWTVDYLTLITVGLVESNIGDSDLIYTIYRDSLNIGTGETVSLSAGTYNYVLNTSGGTNYSANSNMDFETLVVSPISSFTSLTFDVSSPQDFGVAITPSCSVVSGDGSAVLTMDGSVISSGVAITPGAGDLTFNCSLGASQNYTSSENVSVYTVSPISSVVNLTLNSTSEDIIIFQGDSINLGCSVVTGDSLATVELYREGSLIDSGVSSVINLTTFNIVQVENITCSYVDSGNYTTSFETFFVNVTPVPDTTPPFFTTIPLDANINYGEVLSVDFDATDNVLFDSFLINWSDTFSINSAGLLVNVSPLSGGSYSINVSINDSSGNVNWTIYSVVVNPITPSLGFVLTPSNSEDYLIVTTATGSGCPSQLTCVLHRDGSVVTNGESVSLSAGIYNYDYNTTGNVNYTNGSVGDILTVSPVSPVGSLTNSTSWTVDYLTLITVGFTESNTGDSDLTYTVYRDGVSVGTEESVSLSAGTYNYVLNTSGGTNYSSNTNMDSQTLVVSPIVSSTSLSFDVSSPQDFGMSITPTCSVVSGDGSAVLTMDGSVISSGVPLTSSAGSLSFNCSLGATQNYTSSENVSVYTINQISSSVNLTLNSTSEDITIFAGDSINLGCSVVTGDSLATVELYREGLLIDSGISSVNNLTTFNIVQVENITCSYTNSQNYTTSSETFFVNVTPVPDTTPPFFTTIPLDANINYEDLLSVDFDAGDETLFDSFNINWTDTFSINSAGLLMNTSPLSGGSYSINVSINDSSGNVNWTIYSVVVNTISPLLSFALTPSNSENYLIVTTATGSGCPSQLTCVLHRDGSVVTNGESVSLSAGIYNYDYNTTGNVNYTNGSVGDILTVSPVSPVGSLTNSTSWTVDYLTLITVGLVESNTGDSDLTYIIYRDGVSVGTEESVSLSAGTYNYVLNTSGGTNYSANSNMDSQTLVVSPIASFTSLSFDVSSPQDFGVAITPTCSVVSGEGTAVLTMDGSVISSGVAITPGAGTISFNCSLGASTNYTSSENVSVYTVSPISSIVNLTLNSTSENITILQGDSINLGCSVVTGDSLATVELYREGSLIDSGVSSVVNLTTFNIVQVENITCSYTNSQNYTTSFETFFVNVTPVPDTTPPIFTTIPLDANINYGEILSVDFDASDNVLFDSFLINWSDTFSINSAGLLVNTSPLSGGSYSINVSINDSSGNINWTIYSVVVNAISPLLSFVLTPSNSENYLIVTTATGSGCPSQLSCVLHRDGVAVTNGESVSLSAGIYNYDYNTTGNVNYTSGFATDTLTVSPVSPIGSLTNSTSWTVDYGNLITVGLSESNSGDSDVVYTVYRDSLNIGTGESVILSAGTYNYILNTSGGTNYSANSNMDFETLVVSPIASSTSLSFDVSSPQDFGVAITPTCSVLVGDGSAVLTLDGSVIASGVPLTSSAGSLSFNCSLSSSQNYSSSENVSVFVVDQISSSVNLTLNSTSEDITILQGDSINLGCSTLVGDSLATVELYREGSLIDSGISSVNNLTTFNIVQVENITCSYTNSQNYTTSSETFFVNVTPVPDTTPPVFITIPLDANINYEDLLSVDFDAADDVLFDSFLINWTDTFSINSAGLLVNVSPLSGGNYSINVSINDSSGNVNWTIYSVVVNPISPGLSFALTPTNSEDYLIVTTATGSGCPSQLSCDLYRDGSIVTNGESVTLSAGTYNYVYNTTGNVNYTSGFANDTLTVNPVSPVGQLTNSTLWTVNYGNLITVGLSESNSGDSDVVYTVYRDSLNIGTGESVTLSAGTYNYILNTSGGVNYSANSNMDSQTLVVSPIASFTSLSFDVSSPQDFGVAITPTCSVVSGDGSAVLTLDGVVISSGVSLTPGAGSLSFNCSLSASQNYSSSENVSVYTVSPISSIVNLTLNSSSSDITIFAGDSINLGCSVVAGDSLAVIEMYREGLLINSGNSPVNNLTTFSIVQVENVTCSYKNSQNYTTSFETFFVNVTPVPDTTPPVFTTIPLDANINYGDLLSVDFDASDETLFDSFLINWSDTFSINSAGLLVNVSPLSGGSYSINVSINDSSGNVNWTIYSVTVNPISPSLSFVLTPSNSEDYGITVTSTGSGCPSQLSCVLYRDSVAVTNGESVSLSAGSYNYDYNTTGNVNYTNGFASDTLTVSPVSPVGSLTNSTSWTVDYGTLITVGLVESNTGDFDVTYTIYRDGVSVETGETVSLSAGTYNYILNTSGGVNYSANSNMDSQTLIVSLIASSTSLSFDVSSPQDFGVAITPSCSVLVGDGSAVLTLDGSVISSGVSITPGASSMSFNCSLAASTNYGSSESISIYTVNQVSSVVNLTLNSISEDITIFAGDSINLGCSIVTGDSLATVELYREGSLIDSGVSPLNNLTTFNIVQVENITCSYVNSANYTTSFETFFVNVTPVSDTTPPFFTTIPATANINKGEILSVDFDAADDVLFDSFSINWTDTFSINSVGLLVNTSPLSGGSYSINVSINDSSSNINWTLYLVVVNEIFIEEEISGCRSLNVANTSYYLIQDIIATEDCLIVGAENITINFGGYNITGNSSGNGVYSIGQNNLIIKNGEIYDFENGINIVGGNQNQIENMILTSNPYGVILSSVIDTILINNVITNSAENGIRIFGGSNNSLSGNNFSGNSIDFSSSPGSLKIFSLNDIKLEMSTLDIKIVWDDRLNFTSNNLGDAIEISPNRLFVNSSLIPSLNRSARIKINNTDSLNFVDRISLINGAICPSSICVEVSDADIYVFDVAYFSDYIYSIGEGNIGGESSGGGGGPSVSSGGQASIIETIINKNQREEVCLLCSKSLKKHIQRRGNIDYDSEELETLTLEINREIKSPVTMEEINFVLQNFEEECDSYLPLFGGLAIGRSRELSTVVVFISAFFVLLFFIFLYFALRKIRKIKSSRFKRKEKRK